MFVRASAKFFLFVSVFSCSILVPTYTYGEIDDDTQFSNSLDRYTLLNALGKPMKMWIVFTVTVIIGISGHLFVYFVQKRNKDASIKYEEATKLNVSERTLRKHSLFISGVNNELSADEVVKFLKMMFPLLAGSCGVSEKHIEPPLVIQMVRDLEPLMVLK